MLFKNYKKENEVLKAKLESYEIKMKATKDYNLKKDAKWIEDKINLQTEIGKLHEDYSALEQKLEITENRRRMLVASKGGQATFIKKLQKEINDLNTMLNNLTSTKKKIEKEYKKYFDLYNTESALHQEDLKTINHLGEVLNRRNNEIKELKRKLELKENPVTIQELERYQMFGEPRNKKEEKVG